MCLQIERGTKAIVAENDIKCFKILLQSRLKSGASSRYFYRTPYVRKAILDEVRRGLEPFQAENYPYDFEPSSIVDRGFIHTYNSLEDATNVAVALNFFNTDIYYDKYVVYECVIPKGDTYYAGKDMYTQLPCYASTEIKFVKQAS